MRKAEIFCHTHTHKQMNTGSLLMAIGVRV